MPTTLSEDPRTAAELPEGDLVDHVLTIGGERRTARLRRIPLGDTLGC